MLNAQSLSTCRPSSNSSRRQFRAFQTRRHRERRTTHSLQVILAATKQEPFFPPTVSETKARFAGLHTTPIPAVYSTVVLELLVQQHFMRYNKKYKYDPIFALGFVSAFDQILEGFESPAKDDIFSAYLKSLDEDPKKYRSDAAKLETACQELNGSLDELISDASKNSNLLKSSLARIGENAKNGDFYYTKFFAIGLFRVLELTGFKDPKALERLVKMINGNLEFVNRDLKLYKNILTKLSAAKEMMKELTEREKKRAVEREASKAKADIAEESQQT